MTTLNEYLRHKREAFRELRARVLSPGYQPLSLKARVTAEGRSGVRRIRIRDFQVLTDSPRDFVGYDLGPSSPELALGALGSCVAHTYLIQAAVHGLPIDSLEVEVTGHMDQRAGLEGYEGTPVYPHDLHFTVHIASPAPDADIEVVHEVVKKVCPILNLLRQAQTISGSIHRTRSPDDPVSQAAQSPAGVA
jgi:uncharacterized OsmC-like protein